MPQRDEVDDDLLTRLYDLGAASDGLARALEAIGEALGSHVGHLLLFDDPTTSAGVHFFGGAEESFATYDRRWRAEDPRFAAANASFGSFLSDVRIVDPRQFDRSPIYNELLRPFDIRWTLFGNFSVADGRVAAQAFMRPRAAGPFGEEELRGITRLQPHLCRVLQLRGYVERLEERVGELQALLDRLPAPVMTLDASGRVGGTNAAAERLLGSTSGLRRERGRLTCVRPPVAEAIRGATVRTAAFAEGATRSPGPPPIATVELQREGERPLQLLFLPLRPAQALRATHDRSSRVLVVVHGTGESLRLDPEQVSRCYGLTPTEGLLAAAIASGQSVAEFAAARGCSVETARTHLKRVLEKTETRRQPELVRLLLGSTALHVLQG